MTGRLEIDLFLKKGSSQNNCNTVLFSQKVQGHVEKDPEVEHDSWETLPFIIHLFVK